MANALQPSFKKLALDGDIDLLNDDIRAILIDLADYTYSSAHDFLDDVAAAARVDTTAALTGKTTTGGVFDSNDPVFAAASGDVSEAVWLYKHTGVDATANLIAFYDTGITGAPVTPNGGDINVTVHASGWFAL